MMLLFTVCCVITIGTLLNIRVVDDWILLGLEKIGVTEEDRIVSPLTAVAPPRPAPKPCPSDTVKVEPRPEEKPLEKKPAKIKTKPEPAGRKTVKRNVQRKRKPEPEKVEEEMYNSGPGFHFERIN